MTALDVLRDSRTGRPGSTPEKTRLIDARALFSKYGFVLVVIAPTLLATVYFGLVATKQYVSEASFLVRGVSSNQVSGLDMLFKTFGIARAVDDTNAVEEYMTSRDAVSELETRIPLRQMFEHSGVDFIAKYPPFWRSESFESLYDFYSRHVSVFDDEASGLTELRVTAFEPKDAQLIATTLLSLGEEMVNRINDRAEKDTVSTARDEVTQAQQSLVAAQSNLTDFRNKELLVDPKQNSLAAIQTITTLTTSLSEISTQIDQNLKISPSSPGISVLRAQSDALQQQIDAVRGTLGGDSDSLAGKVSAYEGLTLMLDVAEKRVTQADASLTDALQEATQQQIYLEQVVRPNLPDESAEPERLRSIASVFVSCFSLFAIGWILTVGAKEHAN